MTELTANFAPDWVSPPGDTIADLLDERGWTQAEFAQRAGYTTKHVSQLINGGAPITEETATRLERVLGSSVRFWLTREAQYREALARQEEADALEAHADWLVSLPVRDMVRFGWIREHARKGMQVAECLRFFSVASVLAWYKQYGEPVAAFRASALMERQEGAVAAWLRQGEREAQDIVCEPFDRARFRAVLPELRALTNEPDPAVFVSRLVALCASAGVAAVFAPAPKGCPVSGATRWLSPAKALLMLSLRHRTNDHLWFTFFHEVGHLMLHGKRMAFLDIEGELDDAHENEANTFARDLLIPPAEARKLTALPRTMAAVRAFADGIGVAPGIVVGRMQKEQLLPWSYLNGLKVRYHWKADA